MEKMLFMGFEYKRTKDKTDQAMARAVRNNNIALGQWQAGLTWDLTGMIASGVTGPSAAVAIAGVSHGLAH